MQAYISTTKWCNKAVYVFSSLKQSQPAADEATKLAEDTYNQVLNVLGEVCENVRSFTFDDFDENTPAGKSKSTSKIEGSFSLYCWHLMSCGVMH